MLEIQDIVDAILFLKNAPFIKWRYLARRPMASRSLVEWSDVVGTALPVNDQPQSQQET
jgi:hypothetical protein